MKVLLTLALIFGIFGLIDILLFLLAKLLGFSYRIGKD